MRRSKLNTVGRGKTFICVHHNEQTALKAAQEVACQEGGISIHFGAF